MLAAIDERRECVQSIREEMRGRTIAAEEYLQQEDALFEVDVD